MDEPIGKAGTRCGLNPDLVRGVMLLQEKWVMLIVQSLMAGPIGFNELNRQAKGVNTTTLSQRVALLETAGLVKKTVHSTMPPRTSYELTEAGHSLRPILSAIQAWSAEHLIELRCPEHGCSDED